MQKYPTLRGIERLSVPVMAARWPSPSFRLDDGSRQAGAAYRNVQVIP
jgi:hypothetical protein